MLNYRVINIFVWGTYQFYSTSLFFFSRRHHNKLTLHETWLDVCQQNNSDCPLSSSHNAYALLSHVNQYLSTRCSKESFTHKKQNLAHKKYDWKLTFLSSHCLPPAQDYSIGQITGSLTLTVDHFGHNWQRYPQISLLFFNKSFKIKYHSKRLFFGAVKKNNVCLIVIHLQNFIDEPSKKQFTSS